MIMLVLFLILIALGVPVFVAMVLSSLSYILTSGNAALINMAAQRMFAGINSFTLLAIPFFIYAGLLNAY